MKAWANNKQNQHPIGSQIILPTENVFSVPVDKIIQISADPITNPTEIPYPRTYGLLS
jgi:hypothetical protein